MAVLRAGPSPCGSAAAHSRARADPRSRELEDLAFPVVLDKHRQPDQIARFLVETRLYSPIHPRARVHTHSIALPLSKPPTNEWKHTPRVLRRSPAWQSNTAPPILRYTTSVMTGTQRTRIDVAVPKQRLPLGPLRHPYQRTTKTRLSSVFAATLASAPPAQATPCARQSNARTRAHSTTARAGRRGAGGDGGVGKGGKAGHGRSQYPCKRAAAPPPIFCSPPDQPYPHPNPTLPYLPLPYPTLRSTAPPIA